MSGGMTQTTSERKPLSAGFQPTGVAGFEQLRQSCQINLSSSIFHAPMWPFFIWMKSYLPTPACITCKSGTKHPGSLLTIKQSEKWWKHETSQLALLTLPQPDSDSRSQHLPVLPAHPGSHSCTNQHRTQAGNAQNPAFKGHPPRVKSSPRNHVPSVHT